MKRITLPDLAQQPPAAEQLQPFLFQKARRTLPITVKSDTGLCEGEIWFIERDEITFWCVEVLRVGRRYEMRADVNSIGRNVDLLVQVEDAMPGRDAAMSTGFLHRGAFKVIAAGDEPRLLQRFWQINPEHAPAEHRETADPTFPRQSMPPAPPTRPAPPPPAGTARPPGTSPPPRKPTRRPAPPVRTAAAARAAPDDSIPSPPLARAQRSTPELAPGAPPTIMVRYQHREVMQADALLRGEELWLYTGRHPLLWEGQEVKLLLQIPTGSVLELRCTVMADRPEACVLRSRHLHASILANLKVALGC